MRASRALRRRIGRLGVDHVVELGHEVDAPVRVGGEVLDVVGQDLVVADERPDVVHHVDRCHEQADLLDGADDAAGLDEVAGLEGAQDEQEDPGREVGEQPAPRGPDRHPDAGQQRGEARRLDAEQAEDAEDHADVEEDDDRRADVPRDRLVEGVLEAADDQPRDVRDDPAGDEPDGDGAEHLQGECRDQQDGGLGDVRQVHGRSGLLFCPTSWTGSARAFVSRGAASAGQTLDRVRAVRPLDLGRIGATRRTAAVRLTVMVPRRAQ